MAALYHAYITDSLKYRLRTGIEPKPAFRIRFRLILNVRLPLTSGENPVEVANREKVKNIKGQIFGFFFFFFSTNF